MTCRVLGVSRSGYYEWRERDLSARDLADAYLGNTIVDIHKMPGEPPRVQPSRKVALNWENS